MTDPTAKEAETTSKTADAPPPDAPVPLSASPLWQRLRGFYHAEGVNAWAGRVPHYVTNNPYIANSYANIIIRFVQDCARAGAYDSSEPIYVVELGAGSGTFSFYMLKRLAELRDALVPAHVKLVYVMTDFTPTNIEYWRAHPALQPYVGEGLLDFAQFNIETDSEFSLIVSGRTLAGGDAGGTKNPLVTLANYVFDSVSQDMFRFLEGRLQEGLVSVMRRGRAGDDAPDNLGDASLRWSYADAAIPFYGEPDVDAALAARARRAGEGCFAFPVGTLRCIRRLTEIANRRLLLIASDIGSARDDAGRPSRHPELIFEQSFFYMPVDLQVIAQYVGQFGGDHHHQAGEQMLNTSVFTVGFGLEGMPETRQSLETFLDAFGHATVYNLYEHLNRTRPFLTVEMLLTFAASTRWDPHVLDNSIDFILQQVRAGRVSPATLARLSTVVEQFAGNFFHSPGARDTFFNAGMLLQEIGRYDRAVDFYGESIRYFGKAPSTLYNVGVCRYFMRDHDAALRLLREAVELDPQYIMARGWIAQIEHELSGGETARPRGAREAGGGSPDVSKVRAV